SQPEDVAETLLKRLGSGRYADREAAVQALEKLGREALPALRKAREDRDLEIRQRAAAIELRIEQAIVTGPSLVRLDGQERPVKDLVDVLHDQTGFDFEFLPENETWKERSVAPSETGEIPFWRALDAVCKPARLQVGVVFRGPNTRSPVFQLRED